METYKKTECKIGELVVDYLCGGFVGRITGVSEDGEVFGNSVIISFPKENGRIKNVISFPIFLRKARYEDRVSYRNRMKKSSYRWSSDNKEFIPKDSFDKIDYISHKYYYVSEFGEVCQSRVSDGIDPLMEARKESGNYFEDEYSARQFAGKAF